MSGLIHSTPRSTACTPGRRVPGLVSLTGADDKVAPEKLAALSARYPFAEWAVLYYPEREATARNPSAAWRERFLGARLPHTAAHLCGERAFKDLLHPTGSEQRIADIARYGRVQLNVNARELAFSPAEVLALYQRLYEAGLTLILQYHAQSCGLIDQFLKAKSTADLDRLHILFDSSKGRGQVPPAWPTPLSIAGVALSCGYAGGLGPEVLKVELPRIMTAASAGTAPFWIDMESGLRIENVFDLGRAEEVLNLMKCPPHTPTFQ